MANEFDDYIPSADEQQAMLDRDQPHLNNEKTADEKINEMQNKIKVMDDSLTEIILDNLS